MHRTFSNASVTPRRSMRVSGHYVHQVSPSQIFGRQLVRRANNANALWPMYFLGFRISAARLHMRSRISAPACSGISVDLFPLEAAPLALEAAAPLPLDSAPLIFRLPLEAAAPLSFEAAAGAAACTSWRIALCGASGVGFAGAALAATAARASGTACSGSGTANPFVFPFANVCAAASVSLSV